MAEPILKVEGLANLRRTLKRAGVEVGELKELNRQAANVVAPSARAGIRNRTGRLAGTGRVGATQKAGIVRFGNARVPYAGPIHYGWPARRIEANPFATNAAQATEPVWTALYQRGIERIISKIEGK